MKNIIDKLEQQKNLSKNEFLKLLRLEDSESKEYLYKRARAVCDSVYGHDIYIRGLIETTNYCINDCLYCGIRKSNKSCDRYRLTKGQILQCCDIGYECGFRTFVLQGGEDPYYNDKRVIETIKAIKAKHPDCAVTLSLGEKSRDTYKQYFDAGADRYLLRHETANADHYGKLHPKGLTFENRKRCIEDLKDIGYQVGCGIMVGSPYQTFDNLFEDLQYIKQLNPQMVGVGPFIPQKDTPFKGKEAGTLDMTLKLLSIIRLMLNNVLLPATTALGTIQPFGREMGIMAGANVIMPNLSPNDVRAKYLLYDNKICTSDESAEGLSKLKSRIEKIGYNIKVDRGDYKEE